MECSQIKYQSCCTPCSKINLIARFYIIEMDSYRVVNCLVSTLKVIIFICTERGSGQLLNMETLCCVCQPPNEARGSMYLLGR